MCYFKNYSFISGIFHYNFLRPSSELNLEVCLFWNKQTEKDDLNSINVFTFTIQKG